MNSSTALVLKESSRGSDTKKEHKDSVALNKNFSFRPIILCVLLGGKDTILLCKESMPYILSQCQRRSITLPVVVMTRSIIERGSALFNIKEPQPGILREKRLIQSAQTKSAKNDHQLNMLYKLQHLLTGCESRWSKHSSAPIDSESLAFLIFASLFLFGFMGLTAREFLSQYWSNDDQRSFYMGFYASLFTLLSGIESLLLLMARQEFCPKQYRRVTDLPPNVASDLKNVQHVFKEYGFFSAVTNQTKINKLLEIVKDSIKRLSPETKMENSFAHSLYRW